MKMKAKGLTNNWPTRFAREDVKLCFLFKIFSVVFDYICMERTWIRDSSYNIENGVWRVKGGGGGWNFVCMFGGFEMSLRSTGRAIRTKGLITWARLARIAKMSAP